MTKALANTSITVCHYPLESFEVVHELWSIKSMRDPGCLWQEWQQLGNLTPAQSIAQFQLQSQDTVRQGYTYCSCHLLGPPPKKQHFNNAIMLIGVYVSILLTVFLIVCDKYFTIGQKAWWSPLETEYRLLASSLWFSWVVGTGWNPPT